MNQEEIRMQKAFEFARVAKDAAIEDETLADDGVRMAFLNLLKVAATLGKGQVPHDSRMRPALDFVKIGLEVAGVEDNLDDAEIMWSYFIHVVSAVLALYVSGLSPDNLRGKDKTA